MFFKSIQTLLAQVVSLAISMVANEDGTITVTVMPKAKKEGEANASLNTPLVLTGTAEELDAEFVNLFASFTSKRGSLAEQLEATESVLEAAKKESASKATKAVAKVAAAGKPAKTPAAKSSAKSSDDDGDDEGEGGDQEASDQSAKPAEPANLWD